MKLAGVALGVALVLAGLLAAGADAARAGEPRGAPVEIVAALPPDAGAGVATAVLVGRSGQLYHPLAAGRWQRRVGGGVAVDLRAAVRSLRPGSPPTDEVLAVGAESPLFRFHAGTWAAAPLPSRGPAALSTTGPLPTLAIGRHIYTLEGGAWQRRASAARRATAAWAAAPTALVVATADGGLARWSGRRFAPLRTPLAAGDPIIEFVGASRAALYGHARSGAWMRIDRAAAVLLSAGRDLAGFEEQAAGVGPDGRLWLGGALPAPASGRRAVLVRAERDRLVLAAELPPIPGGDRLAVILGHTPTGGLLVVTRAGMVRMRDNKGTWTEGSATGDLPALPSSPGPGSGAPARTR